MPTASWDLATTTARSRPASSAGSPVVAVASRSPGALVSLARLSCSAVLIAVRLPAPIRPVSGLTVQAAAVTGTLWPVRAAWLVTSEG